MSMILSLKQAPAETLDLLIARPELAVVFWMNPDYTPPKTAAILTWIAKLLGHYEPPMELPEAPTNLARNGEELRLDRDVQALLTATGEPPLSQIGQPIVGSDHGYGDERTLAPEHVAALVQDLNQAPAITGDDLRRDFEQLKDFVQAADAESLGLVVQLS